MSLTGNPILSHSEFDPPNNPLVLLDTWLKTADNLKVSEPRGFVLSTIDTSGRPSSRVVLLKASDEKGIIFTTSKESAKGKDLEFNPWAAGTLWWKETIQQVNFTGQVSRLSEKVADNIFQERTREAQAVSAISKQSAHLRNEDALKEQVFGLINAKNKIERPENWIAYHLILESIEFWQGSKDRFHKRLRYDLTDGSWHYCRLQP